MATEAIWSQPDDPAPVAGRARRWEDYHWKELEQLHKEHPAKFDAIKALRSFQRDVGGVGKTDDEIIAGLKKRKRDDLIAEFAELRKAIT